MVVDTITNGIHVAYELLARSDNYMYLNSIEQLSLTVLGSTFDSFLLTHQSYDHDISTWFVQLAKLQMVQSHNHVCIQCTFL